MVDLGCRPTFLSYASTRSSREREALAFVLQLLRLSAGLFRGTTSATTSSFPRGEFPVTTVWFGGLEALGIAESDRRFQIGSLQRFSLEAWLRSSKQSLPPKNNQIDFNTYISISELYSMVVSSNQLSELHRHPHLHRPAQRYASLVQ